VRDDHLQEPKDRPADRQGHDLHRLARPNYKPDPGATPYPDAGRDEFASGTPARRHAASVARGAKVVEMSASSSTAFDQATVTAPAGAEFVIHFNNKESGVPHNVEIKDASGADALRARSYTGPAEANYVVPSVEGGRLHVQLFGPPEYDRHLACRMSAAGTTRPALGPGLVVPKRRAFFRPARADGWGWGGAQGVRVARDHHPPTGLHPRPGYYFTVNRTLDLGVLVWSPINFCSNENETLPCPAPVGALVPWTNPAGAGLPQPRTDGTAIQLGTKILYLGGSDGTTAQSTSTWPRWSGPATSTSGPTRPAARTPAAMRR
jgi:hypothetical protein